MAEIQDEDLFWLVMHHTTAGKLVNGKGPQEDSKTATDEAQAIAKQFPGEKVYLLKVITVYIAETKVKTHLIDRMP